MILCCSFITLSQYTMITLSLLPCQVEIGHAFIVVLQLVQELKVKNMPGFVPVM